MQMRSGGHALRTRALAVVVTICLLLCTRGARADTVEQGVRQLGSGESNHKARLAAALSLSKVHDPRAVIALADALVHDDDGAIRRVAALALEKMLDSHTADDARELAIDAVEVASLRDPDASVRATAAKVFKLVASLRRKKVPVRDRPEVFVNVDTATDASKRAPSDVPDRVTRVVKKSVEKTGYATSWPGGLPTSSELNVSRSRAFIVASTVKKIEITRGSARTTIACTVAIRIAPWSGKDGGEKWEASKAASASGSAKAMTGNSAREITGGVRDCLEAVTEDVTARQVVPFLRRLAQAGT